ncbi:MAG: hypothetical protein PHN82_02045 [bacterium]|nr:hypothetical protein [bacterium]
MRGRDTVHCPDRALIARVLDGEETPGAGGILDHLRRCGRCARIAREQGEMGEAMRAFLAGGAAGELRDGSPCPTAEEIALYAEGRLPLYDRNRLLRHFCACPACARAVIGAGDAAAGGAQPPPERAVREAGGIYGTPRGENKSPPTE